MLRDKGLTEKILLLGIDGMDPRFSKKMVDEGKMPHLKKMIKQGAARQDLMLLGGMPTITPPMWTTLATGAYPMTHGIIDYNIQVPGELDITQEAFYSKFNHAEPLWNITSAAGKKTLVWHWPGGAWPPTSDSPNLMVVDGTSPGGMGNTTHKRDGEVIIIATDKATKGGYKMQASNTSHIDCDFTDLKVQKTAMHMNTKDERIAKYFEDYLDGLVFQDYVPSKFSLRNAIFTDDTNMDHLADWALDVSLSPITEPEGWVNAPEDAKEFTIFYMYGRVTKPALILKKDGKYSQIAVYLDKNAAEPLYVLDEDVYTPNCPDQLPTAKGVVNVVRNMRALEIADDGSYVRMWASCASDCDNSDCWYPRWIFEKIKGQFGPPPATSMAAGQDSDLILKCGQEQWKQAAKWQADSMQYMMDKEGVEVIFSHFHGPDMAGHAYMKYLKDRDTSKVSETEVRKWHEATYQWTDDYIGSFLPYVDKGWTILLFSDHSLICPEGDHHVIGDNAGINVGIMGELGYTVLQKDENGNDLPQVDWEKTRAVQTRANSIYVNLKGRDKNGIVDPADKYALEEQIITDLYGYKDKKTGHRVVSVALHNKDAVLLGMGGPYAADIIFMVHEDYNFDHGESLSTAIGHNDTSVGPIFAAVGPGVKPGYVIDRYIREVDVAPTAAVLLGVDIPAQCEGAPAYQMLTERL